MNCPSSMAFMTENMVMHTGMVSPSNLSLPFPPVVPLLTTVPPPHAPCSPTTGCCLHTAGRCRRSRCTASPRAVSCGVLLAPQASAVQSPSTCTPPKPPYSPAVDKTCYSSLPVFLICLMPGLYWFPEHQLHVQHQRRLRSGHGAWPTRNLLPDQLYTGVMPFILTPFFGKCYPWGCPLSADSPPCWCSGHVRHPVDARGAGAPTP